MADVTVTEGDAPGTTTASFTLSLNGPSAKTIEVTATTGNGTALGADYTARTETFTFEPGQTSKTFDVDVTREDLNESDEAFFVNLTTTTPLNVQLPDLQAVGTIVDDDTLTWRVDDVTVNEGGVAVFTVTLNRLSDVTQSVGFATGGGTATGGADYSTTTGTLNIAGGSLTGTITVPTTEDSADEIDETFQLTLSGPTEGNLLDGQGIATIDDDDGPFVQIGGPEGPVLEGGIAQFHASLTAASPQEIRVDYRSVDGSAVGADYAETEGVFVFAPGETQAQLNISTTHDTVDEIDESFHVDILNPVDATLGTARATAIINDNDGPNVSVVDKVVAERDTGSTDALVRVNLSTPSPQNVTVHWATADGTATAGEDYTSASGDLTIPAGASFGEVAIPVTGDPDDEADETIQILLSAPVDAGALANGILTIDDDDGQGGGGPSSSASIGDVTITSEGDTGTSDATFTVTLTPAPASPTTVTFETGNVSASAPGDYTAVTGTLIFGVNDPTETITVPIQGDRLDEGSETFAVVLSGTALSDAVGIGTILDDDDSPIASEQSVTTAEDAATTITLGASDGDDDALGFELLTAPLHGSLGSVAGNDVAYTPDADYHGSDSFTFRANDGVNQSNVATVSISVTSVNDAPVASDIDLTTAEDTPRSFALEATDADFESVGFTIVDEPEHGTATRVGAQVTYAPDPDFHGQDSLTFMADDEDGAESNLATVFVSVTSVNDAPVARDNAATTAFNAPVEIQVLTNDSDADEDDLFVTEVGEPSHGTAVDLDDGTIRYTPNTNYTGPDSFGYSISDGEGGSDSATVSVEVGPPGGDAALASIADSSPTTEGADQTFSVSVSNPPVLPVTVNVQTADDTAKAGEDYVFFQTTLTFGIGFPAVQTVTVKGIQDALNEGDEEFHVNLVTSGVGVSRAQAIGTIEDNDPMPSVDIGPASTTEGDAGTTSLTFNVTLTAASGRNVSVNYATENGTASAPGDYTATDGTLVFAPRQLSRSLTVSVNGDVDVESDESVVVRLSSPLNAAVGAATGTGTIRNDDSSTPPPPPPPPASAAATATTAATTTSATATSATTTSAAGGADAEWAAAPRGRLRVHEGGLPGA